MDISKLDKAVVLSKLYNHARAQGMGLMSATSGAMLVEEAQKTLSTGKTYFDYLNGRAMKVDLSGDDLDTYLYNRDNGEGAAERALATS